MYFVELYETKVKVSCLTFIYIMHIAKKNETCVILQAQKTTLQNMKQRFDKLIQDLSYNLYEKELEVRLGLLAAIAGENIALLGPPGIAKSMVARRLNEAFVGASCFEYLMSRFSTPDEVFGPVSISRLKTDDVYERVIEGYLPSADIVFLDEIWKAGPAIQNTLLTAINEKTFINGNRKIKIPMKLLIAASNELPAENEGLEALWDRFAIRIICNPIKDKKLFKEMLLDDETQEGRCINGITAEEYSQYQKAIRNVRIPESILDVLYEIRQTIKNVVISDPTNENAEHRNIYISDRRWKKIVRLLRTAAFMEDRKEVVPVDLLLLKHLLWGELDEIAPIRKVVVRSIFSGILKAIGEIKASMKEVIHRQLVRKAANEVARDNIDRDKKIFDLMYYHVCDHDTGNTYIQVSDYQQLPFQRQGGGINQAQGLSHPDPTDNKRTILHSLNPTGSMEEAAIGDDSLPEGWRHVYLERDKNHIYINGMQFEIEKLMEGEKQKLPEVPIKQYDDFYCKIEDICDGISLLRKQFDSSAFLSPEDISEADNYIKILNKEISKLRMEMQKLDEYE